MIIFNDIRSNAVFNKKRYLSYLILFPSLFFLFSFTYLPFGVALHDSLFEFRNTKVGEEYYTGFSNYIRLFNDPVFYQSLWNTLKFIIITVPISILIAFLLALKLNQSTLINRSFRAIFFMPTVIPLVAAAGLWIFIFLPGSGLIDYYLTHHLKLSANNFLGNQDSALFALSILSIWKFSGYYMIFFLAGLQSVPKDAFEAIKMEGASEFQCLRYVTIPMLRPTITFVATIALIYSVTQVDHILMMTNGGPNNSTNVILFYIYSTAQDSFDFGKASAATIITLLCLLVLTIINMGAMEKGAHYEH
ncbi:carbohydrate ABC transporter permease [Thorsellia anophelis]|uniref:carbohydrate ABC transporter permease n=1 Tax=Thorsellia anophelis TaxID=336804 RepID=UPI000B85F162